MTRWRAALASTLLVGTALAGVSLAPAAGDGPQPVKDGRYAGGSQGFFIYFKVQDRTIPLARVYSNQLQSCTGLGGPAIFASDTIDGKGRFKLVDDTTHTDSDFVVKGRFTGRHQATGTVRWTTTSSCPPGTYEFDYRVDRYGALD